MKKLFYGLGTVAAVVTPVVAVVSCGTAGKGNEKVEITGAMLFKTLDDAKSKIDELANGEAKTKALTFHDGIKNLINKWETVVANMSKSIIVDGLMFINTFSFSDDLESFDTAKMTAADAIYSLQAKITAINSATEEIKNKPQLLAYANSIIDYINAWEETDKLGNDFDDAYASAGSDSTEYNSFTIAAKEVSALWNTLTKFIQQTYNKK